MKTKKQPNKPIQTIESEWIAQTVAEITAQEPDAEDMRYEYEVNLDSLPDEALWKLYDLHECIINPLAACGLCLYVHKRGMVN